MKAKKAYHSSSYYYVIRVIIISSSVVGATGVTKMRSSHFAIQGFAAFSFCMAHFKMRAKVRTSKVQAERISESVHF